MVASRGRYLINFGPAKANKVGVDYVKRQLIAQGLRVDDREFNDERYFTVSATEKAVACKVLIHYTQL